MTTSAKDFAKASYSTVKTEAWIQIDTIPFDLMDHNNISIKGILNDQDTVHLMFHTAANGMTLTKQATRQLTSIEWGQVDKVNSWGGESESRYSENNAVQIGVFRWDSIAIWENENSGPTTDGKFGPNLSPTQPKEGHSL